MADKPTKPKQEKPEYATKAELSELTEAVGGLVELLKSGVLTRPAAPVETPLDKEVAKAGPNMNPVNPEWEEKAREIIGDALDHVEVEYLRKGGTIFTIVIKLEKSNAAKDYLAVMKQDRRSREIGNDGIEGVENWCKLVAQNLKRSR